MSWPAKRPVMNRPYKSGADPDLNSDRFTKHGGSEGAMPGERPHLLDCQKTWVTLFTIKNDYPTKLPPNVFKIKQGCLIKAMKIKK